MIDDSETSLEILAFMSEKHKQIMLISCVKALFNESHPLYVNALITELLWQQPAIFSSLHLAVVPKGEGQSAS